MHFIKGQSSIDVAFPSLHHSSARNTMCLWRGKYLDYMTVIEASEKRGVTPRRINYYCAEQRKEAEKPEDKRFKRKEKSDE